MFDPLDGFDMGEYLRAERCPTCGSTSAHHPACPENPSDALASLAVVLGDAYAEAVLAEEDALRLIARIARALS